VREIYWTRDDFIGRFLMTTITKGILNRHKRYLPNQLELLLVFCLRVLGLQNGVAFGRLKVQAGEEFKEVYDRWKAREMTAVKAIGELGVKKTTFYKLVKESKEILKIIL
jgi:hypothetical protein